MYINIFKYKKDYSLNTCIPSKTNFPYHYKKIKMAYVKIKNQMNGNCISVENHLQI